MHLCSYCSYCRTLTIDRKWTYIISYIWPKISTEPTKIWHIFRIFYLKFGCPTSNSNLRVLSPPARMMKNQICSNLVIRQSMLQVICCYKCCLLSYGCGVFNHKLKNHILSLNSLLRTLLGIGISLVFHYFCFRCKILISILELLLIQIKNVHSCVKFVKLNYVYQNCW